MKAERIVIDSNVWIAALVSPSGAARRLVNTVLDREIEVLLSEAVFDELVTRLERPKFDRYREPDAWNLFLSELVELGVWHEDTDVARGVCRDPADDMFLALAMTGRADAIISGDQDLLTLDGHDGVAILTPAESLRSLQERE